MQAKKMVAMRRYLKKHIRADLGSKIVLLTGPRQAGKTTIVTGSAKLDTYKSRRFPCRKILSVQASSA
jgi:predicted AAA+ superfamily ATPase